MKYSSKQNTFLQLVIGMTRMHSTLRVFSKIGRVMLIFRSVLVRHGFPFFFFFFSKFAIIKIIQEPVRALDEST